MEKRSSERFSVNLQTRLFYGNLVYTGTVTNISEGGMFIRTKMSFPVDSMIVMVVLMDDETLNIPVKIIRTERGDNHSDGNHDGGLGVSLLNPPGKYVEFLSNYRSTGESFTTH